MTRWYARGGGIKRMGPYVSQEAASKALRLADESGPLFPSDAFVWSESEDSSRPEPATASTATRLRRRRPVLDLSMRRRITVGGDS